MASKSPAYPETEALGEGEEAIPHGATNPDQAAKYVQALDSIMEKIEEDAKEETTHDITREALKEMRNNMASLIPQMSEAIVNTVWASIKDPTCLTLRPVSEEIEKILEEMMPPEDITPGKTVMEQAEQKGPLSEEQVHQIAELFENLEVVHEASAQTCSIMARLSRSLNPDQLDLVLQASIRPLVQLNTLGVLFDEPKAGQRQRELPDDIKERVQLIMMADPNSKLLAKEQPISPTCILTATFMFKILKKFRGGATQREIQECFNMKPNNLRHVYPATRT